MWWASSFSGWILALGACAVERGSDLRRRQANSRIFFFSKEEEWSGEYFFLLSKNEWGLCSHETAVVCSETRGSGLAGVLC